MVLLDVNFGLKVADWDKEALSPEHLQGFLKEVASIDSGAPNRVCFLIGHHDHIASYKPAFRAQGYKDVENFFWYKKKINGTGTNCYIPSVESCLIAYYPDRKSCHWYSKHKNPQQHHNMVIHYNIPDQLKTKDHLGNSVNPHEKPPGLIKKILAVHAKPGDTILDVGVGAGGFTVGTVEFGCNVIGIERDIRQFKM